MNGVFVVNVNGALCDEAFNSMSAATERWVVPLFVLDFDVSSLHPATWKLKALEWPYFERILILDADTVVSSRCPNPFELFPEDKLTVVTDRQTHQPHRDKAETDEWEIVTGERHKPENYFNTGMMIASRIHAPFFAEAYALCEKFPSLAWHDQTPLNVVMSKHPELLNYTDQSWNFHNPNLRLKDWQHMQKNIYHFPGNPDRARLISEVKWT